MNPFSKALAAALGVTSLCCAPGCMTCRHEGTAEALRVTEGAAFPNPVRQRVHLFMMNGDDLLELGGMLKLRDELCRAGYAKVYYAQKEDVNWYYSEMRRLNRDEPDARMVLLGYGASAARVTKLAQDAVVDNLPLDGVIYLDPAGYDADLTQLLPLLTVTIRSHNWTDSPGLVTADSVGVASGHAGAPRDPGTLAAVVRVMGFSASRVVLPTFEDLPHLPLRDKLEPTPRGIDPATLVPPPPGWDYLRPAPRFLAKERVPAAPPPKQPSPGESLPPPREVPKPGESLPPPREVPG